MHNLALRDLSVCRARLHRRSRQLVSVRRAFPTFHLAVQEQQRIQLSSASKPRDYRFVSLSRNQVVPNARMIFRQKRAANHEPCWAPKLSPVGRPGFAGYFEKAWSFAKIANAWSNRFAALRSCRSPFQDDKPAKPPFSAGVRTAVSSMLFLSYSFIRGFDERKMPTTNRAQRLRISRKFCAHRDSYRIDNRRRPFSKCVLFFVNHHPELKRASNTNATFLDKMRRLTSN